MERVQTHLMQSIGRAASREWLELLADVVASPYVVRPRGKVTFELPQKTIEVNMNRPVVCVPERKLNYKFMAAEAWWILSGDNSVAGIAAYNKHISEFSDDGKTFFGAYGPKIVGQFDNVVEKLRADRDTRQAVLTLWRENPPPSKDIPCTIAMSFMIRDNQLNCHVFMRSNDVWLGTPYDVFNFSMVAHLVCCYLNRGNADPSTQVSPGRLFLTAASSHLYETNLEAAREVLAAVGARGFNEPSTPSSMWTDEKQLCDRLVALRETSRGDPLRWWESP